METKLQHQILLEELFDKNKLIPALTAYYKRHYESGLVDIATRHQDIPRDFIVSLLVQLYLHKQVTIPVLIGSLVKKYGDSQKIADWLFDLGTESLFSWDSRTKRLVVMHGISKLLEEHISKFQFPMPMVIQPEPVECNTDTGYVTTTGSVLLNNAHHNGDVCLDHLNRVNRIPLTLNMNTAKGVLNKWNNLGAPKEGETQDKYESRIKAFEKYKLHSEWVHELMEKTDNKFWLTHAYDKRGRIYCNGYFVTYQGHDFNKAVLEFWNKEHLS